MLHSLADAVRAAGDLARAVALYGEGWLEVTGLEQPARVELIEYVRSVAGITLLGGDAERAARLLGAMDTMLEEADAVLYPIEREDAEQTMKLAQARLGETRYEVAYETGRTLSREELTVEVLAGIREVGRGNSEGQVASHLEAC